MLAPLPVTSCTRGSRADFWVTSHFVDLVAVKSIIRPYCGHVLVSKMIRFRAIDVTKPYKLIGFRAIDVNKPYKLIGLRPPENYKFSFYRFGPVFGKARAGDHAQRLGVEQ